jgi:hypothetical protein
MSGDHRCCISLKRIKVMAALTCAGQVYDPEQLSIWLADHDTDPLTMTRLWTKAVLKISVGAVDWSVQAVRSGAFPWLLLQGMNHVDAWLEYSPETVLEALNRAQSWVDAVAPGTRWPKWVVDTFRGGTSKWLHMHPRQGVKLLFCGLYYACADECLFEQIQHALCSFGCPCSQDIMLAVQVKILSVYEDGTSTPAIADRLWLLGIEVLKHDTARVTFRLVNHMLERNHSNPLVLSHVMAWLLTRGWSDSGSRDRQAAIMVRAVDLALSAVPVLAPPVSDRLVEQAALVLTHVSRVDSSKPLVSACVTKFCGIAGSQGAVWAGLTSPAVLQMLRLCRAHIDHAKLCGDFAVAVLSNMQDRASKLASGSGCGFSCASDSATVSDVDSAPGLDSCLLCSEALLLLTAVVNEVPDVRSVEHLTAAVGDMACRYLFRLSEQVVEKVLLFLIAFRVRGGKFVHATDIMNFALANAVSGLHKSSAFQLLMTLVQQARKECRAVLDSVHCLYVLKAEALVVPETAQFLCEFLEMLARSFPKAGKLHEFVGFALDVLRVHREQRRVVRSGARQFLVEMGEDAIREGSIVCAPQYGME